MRSSTLHGPFWGRLAWRLKIGLRAATDGARRASYTREDHENEKTEIQRTRRRFEVSRKQDAALQRQHYSQLWPTWAEKSYYLVLENVGICSIMNQVIRKKMLVHILQRASIARLCRSSSLDSVWLTAQPAPLLQECGVREKRGETSITRKWRKFER